MTNEHVEDGDESAIPDLLTDLGNLRELDRRRAVLTPGSAAYDAATVTVDAISARVMNRFRDLRGSSGAPAPHRRR